MIAEAGLHQYHLRKGENGESHGLGRAVSVMCSEASLSGLLRVSRLPREHAFLIIHRRYMVVIVRRRGRQDRSASMSSTSLTASVDRTNGDSSSTHMLSSMRMPMPRKCLGQRSSSGT